MSLAAKAIEKRTFTSFSTIVLMLVGIGAFFQLGQLEDPEFTVKTAVVVTMYPGANAAEVELEVSDLIEKAIQEIPEVKEIESISQAGASTVKVFIWPHVPSDTLPQVWDVLRKKVRDASAGLPPGADTPIVSDDFGDVYGFFLAVVGDGFSYAALKAHVDDIKKELSVINGVAKVALWGDQSECIYLDVSQARLAQLGISEVDIQQTLAKQNVVTQAGGVELGNQRMRMEVTGEFADPSDIADLMVRSRLDALAGNPELLRIGDIATGRRGYMEPPQWQMRFDGNRSIGMAISNTSGVNIVALGQALEARLDELTADLPIGIEINKISWQEDAVADSISNFMISLLEAILIVLVVLWGAMGLRTALVVGLCGLVFTIIASFVFMKVLGVDLQRMSLGALIIAMGMMVDNAIVVVDGILVRMQQGMSRMKAAVEAATLPSVPLLGATIIAVLAFYPIAASDEGAGEYCASLFSVVGISLMLSWVLSVTITPVMCMALLPAPKGGASDPYGSPFYVIFRRMLTLSLRFRWPVLFVMLGMLVGSAIGFKFVSQMFFPASARTQFMIDYWTPHGTRIQQVSKDLKQIEDRVIGDERVTAVSTFVGQGPVRFYLPVEPEARYSSYGQLIVNTTDIKALDSITAELEPWFRENIPEARVLVRRYGLGPSETWSVQARISGPAIADAATLRRLGEEAAAIVARSPYCTVARTNWRNKVPKVVAEYDQENARWTSIDRAAVAGALRRSYDGLPVGIYREDDKQLPIILRHTEPERQVAVASLPGLQIRPPFASESVPLLQVTDSVGIEWEDPMIWRWNRRRAITVQAVPTGLAAELRNDIVAELDAIEMPPGYTLEWDGEYRSSKDAQASLLPGLIPAGVVVALIMVGLFNTYRPPLIIVCIVPFALIGVTVGLLVTRQPFGFVALLGAMSLAGMMIKNAIVLLDQVKIEKEEGKDDFEAVMASALSRLRPVVLAAATTVLGVVPLLQDVFWVSMAVTIMFGLAFGTVLTMIGIPVLYAIFYRVKVPS